MKGEYILIVYYLCAGPCCGEVRVTSGDKGMFNMERYNLSVYSLKYAESSLPESEVCFGGNKKKEVPISFAIYLIRIRNRNILVDAGG